MFAATLTPRLNNVLVAHDQRKRLLSEDEAIKTWAGAHEKRGANTQSTNCWKTKMADPDMREREHCVCAANEASDDERVN